MREPEPLTLFTRDAVRIDAGHTPGDGELCIVLAHGFTCSWRQPVLRRIAAALNAHGGVIGLDLRGHGRSGGRSTVGDLEVLDMEAAVAAARRHGYERVVAAGFSLGGAVAVRHAALHGGVDAVVSISAPARWYYRDTVPMRRVHWVIERRMGRLAVRLARGTRVAPKGWDPEPEAPHAVASRIAPVPLLVVHGDADAFLPIEHAYQLYEAARDPRELWVEPGFGHAEAAATPDLIKRIGEWAKGRR
ncbi:alpha/beta fold hydrolase [Actinomadura viridis]|uniref:Pimeloyl-ACP methyl ester carboxylesterase n=1 Tax=Actinomadura viridis TaxID=58110 RepID=A0A931GSE2_9ACTN|nr:alpha/beta fold hydrolase [Actinomadura viridis]MBG6090724.1 pimeloyl-ACP methyl ester carboxylesterase [Actinomadura viridis]